MNQIRKNTVSSKEQVNNYVLYENPHGKGRKILFCGNSITRHAAKESIGWLNDWGMAASAKEKDYVHLIMSAVQEKEPDAAFCICQAATWERAYDNAESVYPMLKPAREFNADVVILRLIENCPLEGFDKTIFKKEYLKLIQYLNLNEKAQIILTSSFWKREGDDIIQEIAKENGWDFIYLGDLGERADMRADGLFNHKGVAHHPGDLGMETIAKRILDKMEHKKIKAIAFDLDHTLYDRYGTLRSIAYLLKQRYRERINPALSAAQIGDMLVEEDKNHIYDGWHVMFEELLAQGMFINPPSFEEYFAFFMEAFQKIAVSFPMVDDMLAGFQRQGYKVGLLTNGEAYIQRGKVKMIGLEDSFDKILAGEEMGIQKPAVQAFEKMAQELGCTPEQMIYVGDNPLNDIEAARRAGCIPIWVKTSGKDWTFWQYEKPCYEVNDILELPELLKLIQGVLR